MKLCKFGCVIYCVFLVSFFFGTAGEKTNKMKTIQKNANEKGLVMTASLSEEAVAGCAIPLAIRLENQSKEEFIFTARGKYQDYDLKVLDSKGQPIPYTSFG